MSLLENDLADSKKNKENDSLRTVQRALDILNCFTFEETSLTLTEIANKISLAKSTTTRLLASLEQNGFIIKNQETLKYKLGRKLYYLGHIAGKSIQIREIAYPIMKQLRDVTKETVNLYFLEEQYRICVEQCEGLQSIRHLVKLGERLPLWAGAGGKVLLAYQDQEFQNQILYRFIDSPEKRKKLQVELNKVKQEGCASSEGEREVGTSAVAVPIFEIDGKVKACVSISGPTQRFTPEIISELLTLAKEKVALISQGNGFQGR